MVNLKSNRVIHLKRPEFKILLVESVRFNIVWKLLALFVVPFYVMPAALHSDSSQKVSYVLAAYGDNNQVWIYDSRRDIGHPIGEGQSWQYDPRPYDLSWSPDGQFLLMNRPRLALYDYTHLTFKEMPISSYLPDLPVSFSLDSKHLFYIDGQGNYSIDSLPFTYIKKVKIDGNGEPEDVWTTQFLDIRGGGGKFISPARVMYEVEQAWYGAGDRILEETPFGILFTSAEYGLVLPEVSLGSERVNYGVLSPDRTQLAAIDIKGVLSIIDLATGQRQTLAPQVAPDLLAWGGEGKIFYSAIRQVRDLFDGLTPDQKQFMRTFDSNGEDLFLPYNQVAVHELDLANGADRVIYQSEAYAISTLIASPDGSQLFFNVIPNLTEWLDVALQSKILCCAGSQLQLSLYHLDLRTNEMELIGKGLHNPTIHFDKSENENDKP